MPRWLSHPADFPELGLNARDRLADVGCGLGGTSLAAAKAGAEVVALDVDPLALEHTRRRLAEAVPSGDWRVERTDCEPIPLPDGWASVVVCTEVLEHVDDPVRFLHELARIGAPGARYLISVPDPFVERLMKVVAPASYFQWPGHQRVYKHATLDRLVGEAGLAVRARPVYPHNFYWSLYWTFGWASGAREFGPGCAVPPPTILAEWSEFYDRLQGDANSERLITAFDRVAPKTQVVFAVKGATDDPDGRARLRVDPAESANAGIRFAERFEVELRAALGRSDELAARWRSVWARFTEMPAAGRVSEILNAVPWPRLGPATAVERAAARMTGYKRSLRDGSLRLGGYDLRWSIRRAGTRG